MNGGRAGGAIGTGDWSLLLTWRINVPTVPPEERSRWTREEQANEVRLFLMVGVKKKCCSANNLQAHFRRCRSSEIHCVPFVTVNDIESAFSVEEERKAFIKTPPPPPKKKNLAIKS